MIMRKTLQNSREMQETFLHLLAFIEKNIGYNKIRQIVKNKNDDYSAKKFIVTMIFLEEYEKLKFHNKLIIQKCYKYSVFNK